MLPCDSTLERCREPPRAYATALDNTAPILLRPSAPSPSLDRPATPERAARPWTQSSPPHPPQWAAFSSRANGACQSSRLASSYSNSPSQSRIWPSSALPPPTRTARYYGGWAARWVLTAILRRSRMPPTTTRRWRSHWCGAVCQYPTSYSSIPDVPGLRRAASKNND